MQANKLGIVKIGRRKITARQYSRVNEGKVKFQTAAGFVQPSDGDWVIYVQKDEWCILPKTTMEFLSVRDSEDIKDA